MPVQVSSMVQGISGAIHSFNHRSGLGRFGFPTAAADVYNYDYEDGYDPADDDNISMNDEDKYMRRLNSRGDDLIKILADAASRKQALSNLKAQIMRFEETFTKLHGRPPKGASDRAPLATTYAQYRVLTKAGKPRSSGERPLWPPRPVPMRPPWPLASEVAPTRPQQYAEQSIEVELNFNRTIPRYGSVKVHYIYSRDKVPEIITTTTNANIDDDIPEDKRMARRLKHRHHGTPTSNTISVEKSRVVENRRTPTPTKPNRVKRSRSSGRKVKESESRVVEKRRRSSSLDDACTRYFGRKAEKSRVVEKRRRSSSLGDACTRSSSRKEQPAAPTDLQSYENNSCNANETEAIHSFEDIAVIFEVCRHLKLMMDLGYHSPQVLAAPQDLQSYYYYNNGRNGRLTELIDSFEDLDVILDVCRHQKRMMELHSPQILFPNGEPIFLPTAIAHEDTTSNEPGPTTESEDLMTQLKNLRITTLANESTTEPEDTNETLSQPVNAIASLAVDTTPESDDTSEILGQAVPVVASLIVNTTLESDSINEDCDQSIPVIASLIVDAPPDTNDAYGQSIPVIASLIDDTSPEYDDTEACDHFIPVIASLVDDSTPDPNSTTDEDSEEA